VDVCSSLAKLVERKSLYDLIRAALRKTAKVVRSTVAQVLTPNKDQVHHTIAYDNCRGFTEYKNMASDLEIRIYFAHSYAYWEHGLNHNTNGHAAVLSEKLGPDDRYKT
jgi:IS30 family transposase